LLAKIGGGQQAEVPSKMQRAASSVEAKESKASIHCHLVRIDLEADGEGRQDNWIDIFERYKWIFIHVLYIFWETVSKRIRQN
jgi:hypothetical protein